MGEDTRKKEEQSEKETQTTRQKETRSQALDDLHIMIQKDDEWQLKKSIKTTNWSEQKNVTPKFLRTYLEMICMIWWTEKKWKITYVRWLLQVNLKTTLFGTSFQDVLLLQNIPL